MEKNDAAAENGSELQGRRSEVKWTRPGAAETVCRERSGG